MTPPTLYSLTAPADTFGMVHLHWDPVPGATGYEVFSTPDLDTPFQTSPDSVAASVTAPATTTELPGSATDAYIPVSAGSSRYYAVSTVGSDGALTLEHPVVQGLADESTPLDTTPPTITGKPIVGDTLSASPGTWQDSPSSYTYQWQRCDSAGNGLGCSDISGATTQTYTVSSADIGDTLVVEVSGVNATGAGPSAVSAPTEPAQGVGYTFTNGVPTSYAQGSGSLTESQVMSEPALAKEFADWPTNQATANDLLDTFWNQTAGLCTGLSLSAGRFDGGIDKLFDPAAGRSDPLWKVDQQTPVPDATRLLPQPGQAGTDDTYNEEFIGMATDDWASQFGNEVVASELRQISAYAGAADPASALKAELDSAMTTGKDLYGDPRYPGALDAPARTGLALINLDVIHDPNAPGEGAPKAGTVGTYAHTVLAYGDQMLSGGVLRINVWDSNFPENGIVYEGSSYDSPQELYSILVYPDGTWTYDAPYYPEWPLGSQLFQGTFTMLPAAQSWLTRKLSDQVAGYLTVNPLYSPTGLHYLPDVGNWIGELPSGVSATAASDGSGVTPAMLPVSGGALGYGGEMLQYPTSDGRVSLSGDSPSMDVRGPGEYMTIVGDSGSSDMNVSVDTDAG